MINTVNKVNKGDIGEDDDRDEQADQVVRLLRKEISHAAGLLIKVRQATAGGYAAAMSEAASRNGDQEDHEYWKRISKEVNRRLSTPPASSTGKPE